MTRSPLFLAALASSAVPGLDPVSVRGVAALADDRFEIAHVRDRQEREWVVKVPRTPGAGAQLDDVVALSALLARRLDLAVPAYHGHAPVAEGRAAVYPRLQGRPLDFTALQPGPLAEAVGRALAHVHNVEHLLYEEAGRPTYDAETHRHRRLSDLDRAAATGHVPTGLLTRWERQLEDVSVWRFAPTAVHGTFTGPNVLAEFDDDEDASTGRVVGLLAWEESRVGDPADDFADLVASLDPDTFDTVLAAYAESRVERPDGHLVRRARLAAEMAALTTLLQASAEGRTDAVERTAALLRELDAHVEELDAEYEREDAARSERSRAAHSDADTHPDDLDPDDPERPHRSTDAEPGPAFPMLAETQAVPMAALLRDGPAPQTQAVPMAPLLHDGAGSETQAVPMAPLLHDGAGSETQAVPMAPLLHDGAGPDEVDSDTRPSQESDASGPDAAPAPPFRGADTVLIDPSVHVPPPVDEGPSDAVRAPVGDPAQEPAQEPSQEPDTELQTQDAPAPRRSEPVPYVDAADSSPFEIDEVEALPESSTGPGRAG
ncbi:phosphotransferase [Intrasporangium sp. YIM S08009]|uniref:phosphotransferase n=1 Tax=Intrasporangium zincisolvens TaxID=3080018 RepID=UPI002B052639|nr:phosphotransferase [Intrasporangium sp. YIM S08009]